MTESSASITLVALDLEWHTWKDDRQGAHPWQEGEGRVCQVGIVVATFRPRPGPGPLCIIERLEKYVKPEGWAFSDIVNPKAKGFNDLHLYPGAKEELCSKYGYSMSGILVEVTSLLKKYFEDSTNAYLVAHNLAADRKHLLNEYSIHSLGDLEYVTKLFNTRGLCTMVPETLTDFPYTNIKVDIPFRRARDTDIPNLARMYERVGCSMLGPKMGKQHHQAHADAVATVEIAYRLISKGDFKAIHDLKRPS